MTKGRKREKVSEIVIYPVTVTDKGLVGYISFTYQNQIRINDCGIYTRRDGSGYRILYPIKQLANGKVISSVYPITKEVGKKIEDFLLSAYDKFLKETVK
jgi:DNA-binding cell septation regulator SpoVG